MPSGVVSLLTDFGTQDPFVGVMKGVMLARAHDLRLVDLTHEIEPQDCVAAAMWLGASFRYFPEGTVHLVVVDPGVGTARRAICARAHGHFFVAPDNGVLAPVLGTDPHAMVSTIEPERLGLHDISDTFHGRDVFAPAASMLASGRDLLDEGTALADWVPLARPEPRVQTDALIGEVWTADRFGNLITNIERERLARFEIPQVTFGDHTLELVRTYADVAPGEPVALINAFSMLEIGVREDSAENVLGAGRGDRVTVSEA